MSFIAFSYHIKSFVALIATLSKIATLGALSFSVVELERNGLRILNVNILYMLFGKLERNSRSSNFGSFDSISFLQSKFQSAKFHDHLSLRQGTWWSYIVFQLNIKEAMSG